MTAIRHRCGFRGTLEEFEQLPATPITAGHTAMLRQCPACGSHVTSSTLLREESDAADRELSRRAITIAELVMVGQIEAAKRHVDGYSAARHRAAQALHSWRMADAQQRKIERGDEERLAAIERGGA